MAARVCKNLFRARSLSVVKVDSGQFRAQYACMKSMTGFGQAKVSSGSSDIEVSIRAVNGRFFEPRFHMPRELVSLESDLRTELQKRFNRGTIDIFISRRLKWDQINSKVLVQKSMVKEYHRALKEIATQMKIPFQAHVELVAKLPEVLKVETNDTEVTQTEKKAVLKTLVQASEACVKEQSREGLSLKKEFERLLKDLDQHLQEIEKVRAEVDLSYQQKVETKIKTRLAAMDSNTQIDPSRVAQEVVFLLDKSDINEEIVRLREHLHNFKGLLKADGPMGKKLDFYIQELLREVNTIGSKSSVSKLTSHVVDAKTIIERLREQVQNVE